MEQRTDQVVPAVPVAGIDPSFIPGITAPAPSATAAKGDTSAASATAKTDAKADADTDTGTPREADTEQATAAVTTAVEPDGAADEAGEAEEAADADEPDGGPVFEAADRRATIVADHRGITLRLDGESAEFGWDEIGAVEIDTPRFGKRFGITVYTSGRRWYKGDVEAPSRAALKRWTAELDAVLDARFEDEREDEEPAADEPEGLEEAEAEAAAEATESEAASDAEEAGAKTAAKSTAGSSAEQG
ncbi:hypothetical protein [Actinacidiphila acididurans]|uniref:Uncharacterized protein n=1 Tax=Actinacidiphila acididurans TaxID=2784346 RepID=A0ABS2U083_9ACTN|nr:hypothetical protein [Actinacidiphila acididurans]MBM9509005.1 hypothetical protein [Actinacidiphila acididurans]